MLKVDFWQFPRIFRVQLISNMSKKSGALMAFLSGAALGAVLGILYAPDKGSNTREKLTYKLDKYKGVLEQFLDDLVKGKETPLTSEAKSQGAKVVNEAKNKAERLLEDVDDLLTQIRGTEKS